MVEDARFEDGDQGPLRLQILDDADLRVLGALVQDAVFPITEMTWQPAKRRFAILLNRFRWEDGEEAEKQHRGYERVQALLVVEGVLKVASNGINRRDKGMILSLLDVTFTAAKDPAEAPAGRLELVLAGDGAIALDVECLDITLSDVTRPYLAPSRAMPDHGKEE